ncbi:MAG: hypothetical protein ACFFCW_22095 [Candidatus Hodarchaeota archaeon]
MNRKISIIIAVAVILFAGLLIFPFHTREPIIEKHLDSVDWLPSSATDISYYKRNGFGWIKNYKCFIPEDDFLKLAAKEEWKLKEDENVLFYEKRYPNGGGVTVYYDKDSKRLFVHSSHR